MTQKVRIDASDESSYSASQIHYLTMMDGDTMANQIRLTDAQFAVLESLWDDDPQTIRQLTAKLYPKQTASDYGTVQKLLEQLEAKRCVQRERSEIPHVFEAAVDRGDLIDSQLQDMADRLCGGSLSPVLLHLVEGTRLSKKDRDMLRGLLQQTKRSKKHKGQKS